MRALAAALLLTAACGAPQHPRRSSADVGDLCPNEPEDHDGFQDDDGCPDPDNDRDGILDEDDPCPDTAGECPATAPDGQMPPTNQPPIRPTPWTITYGDGSANQYRFHQPAAGAEVTFEYDPVTPAESSSGFYSGGAPRHAEVPAGDARVAELWRRVEALERDPAVQVPDRAKGTGAFGITTPAGSRTFIVASGPTLQAFHDFAAGFDAGH